jgi:hypothetical protein
VSAPREAPDGAGVTALKVLVLAGAVLLWLWPLATPPGLVAGVAGTVAGLLLARRLEATRVRLPAMVAVGLATAAAGHLLAHAVLALGLGGPTFALMLADVAALGLSALGGFFAVRLLSSRLRVFSVLELSVVVFAVAHAFADHRHERINQPRFLSDFAWSNGLEPEVVLSVIGVVAVALSALLLLRTRRASRVLAMLLLLLAGGVGLFLLVGAPRLSTPQPDELGVRSGEDSDSNSKDKDKDKNGGSKNPPEPVAVAVLHDELPEADVLYFRQAVRSHLVGDRLVEDSSGAFDTDVPRDFPSGAALEVTTPQVPAFHRTLYTSMYLLVDHAQLFGLANPTRLTPLENPNPRRFVAAYDVDSLFLLRPIERLIGHDALPPGWSPEMKRHYTEVPADPRYRELSNRLVRDVDPRFVGDDVMKALAIKTWLEKNGFYSLEQKTLVGEDPTAKFLFGDLRGYCVHFAHAAVFLLRSQGIPARVAIGYGVQTQQRGAGSAVLIYGNEAHAWPELYLDGVGWVTFDIYPEKSDEPISQHVDQDLTTAMGELARKDPTGGRADPRGPLVIPWRALFAGLALVALLLLVAAFAVKVGRRLARGTPTQVYRGVLDRLSDLGQARRFGETRERHAARLKGLAPSFEPLTRAHLRLRLGRDDAPTRSELAACARAVSAELRANLSAADRARLVFNPIGWWFTR